MKFIMDYIRKEEWSPYVAGILLGIVGVLAVLLSNSLLGASGAFENLAGLIGKAIAPQAFDNMYFNFIMPPGFTWGVMLLIGVFFGGMLGAFSSNTFKWRLVSDERGKKFLDQKPGNAGCWLFWALSFWNMAPGLREAAPAAWQSRAACC